MACLSVALLGCVVRYNGEVAHYPAPDAFRAFERVFRPLEGNWEAEGRATKRRRLPNGQAAAAVQPSYDVEKSAVLTRVTLCLGPSSGAAAPVSLSGASRASVPLQLASFSRKSDDQIVLSAYDPASATTIHLTATASPESLDPLATHLDMAAAVGAEWEKSSPSSRNDYIPFCRCNLLAPEPGQSAPRLEVELRWPFGISLVGTWRARLQHRANMNILSTYLPDTASGVRSTWTPADFYDAVHVPENHDISPRIENSLSSATLYPYQQRSVDWMLRREGVTFSSTGDLQKVEKEAAGLPVSFFPAQDNAGRECYVSHARGMIISDLNHDWDSTHLHGGILAEEMGLGKSVELISLMCLHKRDMTKTDVHDPYLVKMVKPSGATLIITPPAILEQWISEINKHAPHLKCFHYNGLTRHTREEATIEHLLQFDVVVTSYDVLSREVHHVTPPPDRPLRRKKEYEHRTSPLVGISWWRVCLDEAQMVESGVSQAAMVARMIPRCNAWAVSGTPLRSNVTDLVGLLVFLRCEPFANTKNLFARLDKTSFRDLINRMALRHTKDQIRGELDIPPQRRVVITVPFTAIEEVYYKDMFRQMCEACFLSPEGVPLREDRGIDHPETIERMREWLVRLRQICLHSHVGEKNRKFLGPKKQPLRTVQEVLQVMIDQNETKTKLEAKEMILAQMRRGHIYSFAQDIASPKEKAITYYEEALQTTLEYVKLGREEIQTEVAKLRMSGPSSASQYEGSQDEYETDETSAKFAHITILRRSLRSFLELEHACYFFIGNMYFQWKENKVPDSAEYNQLEKSEKAWYDKAQSIRQELLKDTEKRTRRQMRKIADLRAQHQNMYLPEVEDLGGIESSNVLEKLDTITQVINSQSTKLKEWRNKIIEILTMSLVDSEEEKETTGDEYETSLRVQDELYVYIQAFRTLVADMTTAVHGTEDTLVNHEMEQAVRQARDEDITKRGHAPDLLLQLAQERAQLRPKPQQGSLKGVVASARQVTTTLQYRAEAADKRAAAELAIAQKYLAQVQEMFSTKTELTTELEKELEQFRLTMNLRLEFYRQIQHISETVEDYKDEMDETFDHRAFTLQSVQIEARRVKIQRFKVKQTYLNNLRDGAAKPEETCTICLDPYERGILTTCGHKYCRECIFTWWKINHNCPECRTALVRGDLKDITHNKTTVTAQEEHHDSAATASPASSPSSAMSIYSSIHNSTMNEIKTVKLEDSYGSKIDMMARHLLWIRNNDPGAKTIIYSQFADFLQVLCLALRRFRIGVSGIRDKNGIEKFKKDPAVECFLLDAKSNSSGLNLVNATYVFLCEPLINPALELQAIARVHRIGQKRATTVFMYIVGNTVEEAIYDISVKRRLEHMGRDANSRSGSATDAASEQVQERKLDVANSEEIKTASLSKLVREGNQGEVVVADDLWKCLFGKARNVPSNDEIAMLDDQQRQHELRVRREQFLQHVEAAPGDQLFTQENHAAAMEAIANVDVGELQMLVGRLQDEATLVVGGLGRPGGENGGDAGASPSA
ncbi:hypothetical protein BU23DRAFT_556001 [Bimuria novae-zelandiae CBS 107.79]|uniref:RING-type domain-containing protein n=1 Tax=Bimuria novae-zelandiae CBS 107.79 TaxID=1447943 RepID=A0A6A5V3L5_9PLEO|nr:hypothetical protein BU23DRAFT_556001 [Bimuria novae-zelandiae CBS 107.79]